MDRSVHLIYLLVVGRVFSNVTDLFPGIFRANPLLTNVVSCGANDSVLIRARDYIYVRNSKEKFTKILTVFVVTARS